MMVRVKFVPRDGAAKKIALEHGIRGPMAAVRNDVRDIGDECGDYRDRPTRHIHVGKTQARLVPPSSEEEIELLSHVTSQRKPDSRLSCQLKAPSSIDEFIVCVPESQS
jgi:2Fe-2S ferredoxin